MKISSLCAIAASRPCGLMNYRYGHGMLQLYNLCSVCVTAGLLQPAAAALSEDHRARDMYTWLMYYYYYL